MIATGTISHASKKLRYGISEIASLADPEVGELRIGTTPPMSAVASAVFNRLVPRYPRMTFELNVGGTDLHGFAKSG